jgi:hypothetical protein
VSWTPGAGETSFVAALGVWGQALCPLDQAFALGFLLLGLVPAWALLRPALARPRLGRGVVGFLLLAALLGPFTSPRSLFPGFVRFVHRDALHPALNAFALRARDPVRPAADPR